MSTIEGRPVRVRMAPSPTGFLHIGTARTTLFNLLFARHNKGTFILRIEDTDEARSTKEFELELIEGLRFLGISWDEGPDYDPSGNYIPRGEYGPYRQSDRIHIYKEYLEKMLADGTAYYCYCTKEELEADRTSREAQKLAPKYSGRCRDLKSAPEGREAQVIRFRMPEEKVSFEDMIRGTVEFDTALFGDVVIAKSVTQPLYNFAVVVDDELMDISHVIRGEEHISNTPKQILLQRALGMKSVLYAHLPLILKSNGKGKLSKRDGGVTVEEYRKLGYLPEAITNFIALLGWHPEGDREIFSLEELYKEFDLSRVQKHGAKFDPSKLAWINSQYIKGMKPEDLVPRLSEWIPEGIPEDALPALAEVAQERMTALSEFPELIGFYSSPAAYTPDLLVWKKSDKQGAVSALTETEKALLNAPEEAFKGREEIRSVIDPLVDPSDKGAVLWPLRAALSGEKTSPDPFTLLYVLGKEKSLARVREAIKKINE